MTHKKYDLGTILEITFLGSVSSIEDFSGPVEWTVAGTLSDEDHEAYYIDSPKDETDKDSHYNFHTILRSSVVEIKEIIKKNCH